MSITGIYTLADGFAAVTYHAANGANDYAVTRYISGHDAPAWMLRCNYDTAANWIANNTEEKQHG